MKTQLIALSLTLLSANAFSANYKFVSKDQTTESQLCVVAATQGVDAAKEAAAEKGLPVYSFFQTATCNGMSINRFARKYQAALAEPVAAEESTKIVKLVAAQGNFESELCVAVANGKKEISREDKNIFCNGKAITSFARQYAE